MKKKNIRLISLTILIVASVSAIFNLSYILPWKLHIDWVERNKTSQEKLLYDFIEKKLSKKNYGIYTNYLEEKGEGDITKGHMVLSESEGIMMLYAVEQGDKALFDEHFNIIQNSMITKEGLVAWRKDGTAQSKTSATIDDLRIVKASAFAYDRWGEFKYRRQAIEISKSILKNSKGVRYLVDYNDGFGGKSGNTTICYLDLYTMSILSKIDGHWSNIYEDSKDLINKAKVSVKIPLYYKFYDNNTEKFEDTNNIDLLTSLIVVLNKVEANEDSTDTIVWVKGKLKKDGALYSTYDKNSGKPTSTIESTSIYSILALIAKEINDEELYNNSMKKLLKYQVKDINSEIYGSFGDDKKKEVYSFDNLNALRALQGSK